jgi:hypothetical protein
MMAAGTMEMACQRGCWPVAFLRPGLYGTCKGNLTDLRRKLHLSLAKGNPKRTL